MINDAETDAVTAKISLSKKILLIGYAYPPSSSPGSIRMSRLAARFNPDKFETFVVTAGQRVTTRATGLEDPLPASRVFKTDDPLAKIMSNAGASVKSDSKKAFSLKAIVQKLIFPDRTIFWALNLRSQAPEIRSLRPDVILTSSPPLSAHIAGRYFAKKVDSKWIAEFRDPASWLPIKEKPSRFKQYLLSKFESWVVRKSDATITISQGMTDYFVDLYPSADIHTIPNGAEVDEVVIAKNMMNVANRTNTGPLIVTHAGSLYGGERKPGALIQAAKIAQPQISRPIRLQFIGGDGHLATAAASELDAIDLVHDMGALGHDETVKLTEQSNGLIALLHDDPIAKIGIMSKFFDYVATGNPVAVVGGGGEGMLSRIVEEEGAGNAFEYDQIDELANWIVSLANEPKKMLPDALSICKKWSADVMAKSVEELFGEYTAD